MLIEFWLFHWIYFKIFFGYTVTTQISVTLSEIWTVQYIEIYLIYMTPSLQGAQNIITFFRLRPKIVTHLQLHMLPFEKREILYNL